MTRRFPNQVPNVSGSFGVPKDHVATRIPQTMISGILCIILALEQERSILVSCILLCHTILL